MYYRTKEEVRISYKIDLYSKTQLLRKESYEFLPVGCRKIREHKKNSLRLVSGSSVLGTCGLGITTLGFYFILRPFLLKFYKIFINKCNDFPLNVLFVYFCCLVKISDEIQYFVRYYRMYKNVRI